MWHQKSFFPILLLLAVFCEGLTCSASNLKQKERQHRRAVMETKYRQLNQILASRPLPSLAKNGLDNFTNKKGRATGKLPAYDTIRGRGISGGALNRTRRELPSLQQEIGSANSTSNLQPVTNSTVTTTRPLIPSSPPPFPGLPSLPNTKHNTTMHCQGYWLSCRGRCKDERDFGATEERRQCFCDTSCEFFQDCCADYDQHCPTLGISTKEEKSDLWECVRGGPLTETDGIWMISSCPKNWTQDDVRKGCSRYLDISFDNYKDGLPVIDREGNTYKNHFCAQCHGLKVDDIVSYNLNFSCFVPVPKEYNASESLRFFFSYCSKVFWQPPAGFSGRYCYQYPTERTRLHVFPPDVPLKCSRGRVRVVFDLKSERNFLNSFCSECNGATRLECGPGHAKDDGDISPAKPFSIVMDVGLTDDADVQPQVRKREISCGLGNVYDFYLQMCRRGIKPSDKFLDHNMSTFSVSVWLKSQLNYAHTQIYENAFKKAFLKALKINQTLISDFEIRNPSGPVSTAVFNIDIPETEATNVTIQDFTRKMNSFSVVIYNVNFTVFKVTAKPLRCVKLETIKPEEYIFREKENRVQIVSTGEVIPEEDFYTNATEWRNETLIPVGFIFVCKRETRLDCSGVLVDLSEDEYVFLSDGLLYRNISGQVFALGKFQSINGTIWICANFSKNYTTADEVPPSSNRKPNNKALVILTHVGLSLSVVCLVLVLVTFAIFNELRTLPGINLMNLSSALLLMHSLYFATGQEEAPIHTCTVIAVLLHYFFLVSFLWMSIITFDTWRAMSKLRVQRRSKKRRKVHFHVMRCVALGWLPAFVFVAICVALDQSKAVVFNYGGVKGCWINSPIANLFFFVLPVALSVSFNAVFFALTVKVIYRTRKQAQRATTASHCAFVFLKIFVLMGFTWVFGFLRVLVSPYFDYPFIVFTTLQGVYIAIAFVFTARVKNMYCKLFRDRLKCISVSQEEGVSPSKDTISSPAVVLKYVKKSET